MTEDEKVRLGGMALPNGVLVHGPNSWACAIRDEDGRIEVASALKRFRATKVSSPFLRGPARLAEAMALLPQVKHALPNAKLPMQNRRVLSAMLGAALVVRGIVSLPSSRAEAYRWFVRGVLVWLLISQIFIFYESQLAGLAGLAVDLAAYGMLLYALRHERASVRRRAGPEGTAAG